MSYKLSEFNNRSHTVSSSVDTDGGFSSSKDAGRPKYQRRMRILWIVLAVVALCVILGGGLSTLRHKKIEAATADTSSGSSSNNSTSDAGDGDDPLTTVVRNATAMAIACNYTAPALNITMAEESAANTTLPVGFFSFTGVLSTATLPGESTENITSGCSPNYVIATTINQTNDVYEFDGLTIAPTASSSGVISFGVSFDLDSDGEGTVTTSEFYELLIVNGNITTGSLTIVYNSTAEVDVILYEEVSGDFVTCVYLDGIAADQASADGTTEIDTTGEVEDSGTVAEVDGGDDTSDSIS